MPEWNPFESNDDSILWEVRESRMDAHKHFEKWLAGGKREPLEVFDGAQLALAQSKPDVDAFVIKARHLIDWFKTIPTSRVYFTEDKPEGLFVRRLTLAERREL